MDKFVNEINTRTGEKRRGLQNKIASFLEEKKEDNRLMKEALSLQDTCNLEDNLNVLNESTSIKKEAAYKEKTSKEKDKEFLESCENYCLKRIIESSLLIDKKTISLNKQDIDEKISNFRNELLSKVNKEESSPFTSSAFNKEIGDATQCYIESMRLNPKNKKQLKISLKEHLDSFANEVIPIIKEKVKNVIIDEKILSECLDMNKNKKINKQLNENTLFRNLLKENTKIGLKETKHKNLTKALQASVFYETLTDYTLLETFNTLGMFGKISPHFDRRKTSLVIE